MNILVTGACGQLGRMIRSIAPDSRHRFIFADIAEAEGLETLRLDVTDEAALRRVAEQEAVDVIVNCAGYTNVDGAESEPELAERLNAAAPALMARIMQERGGLLIHPSTDYVFGGEPHCTPYDESQPCSPLGIYGISKFHGEQAIQAAGGSHVILRTAWLYSPYGRNFLRTMLQLTAQRPRLQVVSDQTGTPTYALGLAQTILHIVDDYGKHPSGPYPRSGIYHYTDEGVCSWYDFAQMIATMAGHRQCDICPCHSADYPTAATRPSYSVLDKTKIKKTFGIRIPHWTDSLRECLGTMGYGCGA